MKANELRIGNYFKYGEKTFTVLGINNNVVLANSNRGKIDFGIESIEAIAITEEWLIKFGFTYHKHQENMYFILGMQVWQCGNMFICNKNGIILKHVHQLQNLYFALTNKELLYDRPTTR